MTKRKSKGAARTQMMRSEESLERDIEDTQRRSVVPGSDTRYVQKIWTMKKWLRDRYGPEKVIMSTHEFSLWIADGKDGKGIKNANSAKAWRTAWKYWQDTEGMDVTVDPKEDARLTRQIKGLRYNSGEGTLNQADVIDSGRLRSMTSELATMNELMYAIYFVFMFYAGFRKKLSAGFFVKDVRFDTDVGTVIHSNRTKSARPGNVDLPGMLHNFKEVNNLTDFLKALVDGKDPDEPLFPALNEHKANNLIKKMALKLHWGTGNWSVMSLRHGTSREAQAVVADVPSIKEMNEARLGQRMSKRMGHISLRSKLTYQKSNGKKKK